MMDEITGKNEENVDADKAAGESRSARVKAQD
jgi:hypothetical protein